MEVREDGQNRDKSYLNQVEIQGGGNFYKPVNGLTDSENLYEQAKEQLWENALPGEFAQLEGYLANDGYLSNEELTAAIEKERMERDRLLAELEKETGAKFSPEDYPHYITTGLTFLPMNNTRETEGAVRIDPLDLSKLELQPSFMFAKDESGAIKVVSQEPENKNYQLKDANRDQTNFFDAVPKVFTDKGILASFLENFSNAKGATENALTNTGKRLSELVRGKVDLIMIKSGDGYPAALDKAKAMLITPESNIENNVGTNSIKEDIKMQYTNTKFKEADVDWQKLGKLGITKDRLQLTGQLDKFLNGERTSVIDPSTLKEGQKYFLDKMPFALKLKEGSKGPEAHVIFKENKLNIPERLQGQKLSVEDRLNLITKNHLGRTLQINGKPHFVSVDRELNQVSTRDAESIKIPSKIKLANGSEIQLTKDQQQLLSQGKPALIAGLMDNKNQPYTGHLIINAASGKMDIMKEVAPSMTQTQAQNQDKSRVLQNNEGQKVRRTPAPGKGQGI